MEQFYPWAPLVAIEDSTIDDLYVKLVATFNLKRHTCSDLAVEEVICATCIDENGDRLLFKKSTNFHRMRVGVASQRMHYVVDRLELFLRGFIFRFEAFLRWFVLVTGAPQANHGRGGHMHAVYMQRWLAMARPPVGAVGHDLATCKGWPPAGMVGCSQPVWAVASGQPARASPQGVVAHGQFVRGCRPRPALLLVGAT
ncbi:hypothetical protein B296_00039571, partial [Ensete ventricosum]